MPRPKKPTRLKILDGDQPCRINNNEPKSPAGLGEPPEWLDELGREAWAGFKSRVDEMGLSTRADDPAAELYSSAYSTWRKALELVKAEGMVIETETTMKAHPCLAVASTCERQMLRILGQFGMTPAGRAGLRVDETADDNEVLDHFRPKVRPNAKGPNK